MKFIAILTLALWSTLGLASELKISLPTGQELTLETPPSWSARIGRVRTELPQAIVAESSEPFGFKIAITPFWPEAAKGSEAKNIRTMIGNAAEAAKPDAVNQIVEVQSFTAPEKQGFFFVATAAATESDGYKYLSEGAVQYGSLLITYTVLANEKHKRVIEETLQVLRAMRANR